MKMGVKSGSTGQSFPKERVRSDVAETTGSSAGVGRTGTFIALSSLLISPGAAPLTSALPSPLGPLPKEHHDDHVAQTVDSLREWRGMMVQTSEQLALIYEMVSSGRR